MGKFKKSGNILRDVIKSMYFAVLEVVLIVAFNPISFGIVALMAPKMASRLLRKLEDEDAFKFFISWNKYVWHIMPWRIRKAFVEAFEFRYATIEDQLRYFSCSDRGFVLEAGWLKGEAFKRAWTANSDIWEIMLPYIPKGELTEVDFRCLVYSGKWEAVKQALLRSDVTDGMLCALVKAGVKHQSALNLFCWYVKHHGASAQVVNAFYQKYHDTARTLFSEALTYYADSVILEDTRKNPEAWREYITGNELDPKLQAIMTLDQYKIWHETKHKLDEEALIKILTDGGSVADETVKNLFEDEEEISDNVGGILSGSRHYIELLFQLRQEQEEKKN